MREIISSTSESLHKKSRSCEYCVAVLSFSIKYRLRQKKVCYCLSSSITRCHSFRWGHEGSQPSGWTSCEEEEAETGKPRPVRYEWIHCSAVALYECFSAVGCFSTDTRLSLSLFWFLSSLICFSLCLQCLCVTSCSTWDWWSFFTNEDSPRRCCSPPSSLVRLNILILSCDIFALICLTDLLNLSMIMRLMDWSTNFQVCVCVCCFSWSRLRQRTASSQDHRGESANMRQCIWLNKLQHGDNLWLQSLNEVLLQCLSGKKQLIIAALLQILLSAIRLVLL